MATPVHELELPLLDTEGMGREEALGALQRLRDDHWLVRTALGYAVMDHRDVVAVLRERRFHSAISLIPRLAGVGDDAYLSERRPSILGMEGPEHARLRRLVAPAFTPAAADRLRPFMQEVLQALVEPVVGAGRCELVKEVCEPYPIPIICELLGAPKEDWKLFSQWATDIFRLFNQDFATDQPRIEQAARQLEAYISDLVEERRRRPGEDLLSDLIAAEEAGDRLSTDEMVMLAESVLMAGTDTTRNQLACAMALFATHPDQWRELRRRPQLLAGAVEESMRYLGAVSATVRFAAEDVEYRDVLFPAGTLIMVSLAGANRTPSVFEVPDTFDITRPRGASQLGFGAGIHHCMGAALARAELQEALGVLTRSVDTVTLDGPIEWKPPTFGIWGPARLPLRCSPRG